MKLNQVVDENQARLLLEQPLESKTKKGKNKVMDLT